MNFPLPANETERLQALRKYNILDTPSEAAFDRVAELALQLFNVPIALISLLDNERQWFKACYGLDTRQTDRGLAFCTYAILTDQVMVVPDAREDARFANNPLVTGPQGVRFYAGAPLKTPDGFVLGTFCIMDRAPRRFSTAQQATLASLAAIVVDEMELHHAGRELREEIAERRHAEAELQRQADVLREQAALLDLAHDTIMVRETDGKILFWNDGAQAMYGWTQEEAVGQISHALLQTQFPQPLAEIEARARQARRWEGELTHTRRDGTHVVVASRWVVQRDEQGQAAKILEINNDITDRKRAEETLRTREATLQAILGASPDIVCVIQADGRLEFVSQVVEKVLGYAAAELRGKPVLEFVDPEDQARVAERIRGGFAGEQHDNIRFGAIAKDGHLVVLEAGAALVDVPGLPPQAIVTARDVTKQVQLEDELRLAKADAERANTAKSEFLSRMSHELRTPLNAILGFSQLLEMDELTVEQRRNVELILKGGRHLLDLINEVLDIARIEAGRMDLSLEPIAVHDVVRETLDFVRPLAAPRRIQIEEDGAAAPAERRFVQADRQRLKQVLLNLLGNAIKYNYDGGRVSVECERAPDNGLRILVRDTGPGIAPEKMERLFVPFDRLGAEQSRIEGTGLGLALSQRLIEAMGGQMGAESMLGQGSTFWIALPVVEAPDAQYAPSRNESPSEPVAQRQQTLLYIEDNPSDLKLVERILQRRPAIKLLSAMQARIGLDLAREHRPDMILLDLHLPDLPGREVLLRLRSDPATGRIPVVVLSADATPGQLARLLSAGADRYVTKPLDVQKFLDVVDKTLQKLNDRQ